MYQHGRKFAMLLLRRGVASSVASRLGARNRRADSAAAAALGGMKWRFISKQLGAWRCL